MNTKLKDINLYYAYQLEKRPKSASMKFFLLLFAIEIMVLVLISSFNTARIYNLKKDIYSINSLISKQMKRVVDIKQTSDRLKTLDEKQRIIDEKFKAHERILFILNELEKAIPQNVTIQTLSISQDKVSFVAKSADIKALFHFLTILQSNKKLSKVSYTNITSYGNINFITIDAEIMRK